jgi:hypothetical protein
MATARHDIAPLSVRLPRTLVRRLNVIAAEQDRYLYDLVEDLLKKGLKVMDSEEGKTETEKAG